MTVDEEKAAQLEKEKAAQGAAGAGSESDAAKLLEVKKTLESDLSKEREGKRKAKEEADGLKKKLDENQALLKKALGISDGEADDPKAKLDAKEKAESEGKLADLVVSSTTFRALASVANTQEITTGDPDYVAFRVGANAELRALAASGDAKALAAKLTEAGLLKPRAGSSGEGEKGGEKQNAGTAGVVDPKAGAGGSEPKIETYADLLRLGGTNWSAFVAYKAKYPDKVRDLHAAHFRGR